MFIVPDSFPNTFLTITYLDGELEPPHRNNALKRPKTRLKRHPFQLP